MVVVAVASEVLDVGGRVARSSGDQQWQHRVAGQGHAWEEGEPKEGGCGRENNVGGRWSPLRLAGDAN